MALSPFYLFLWVYFLANTIAAWSALWVGGAALDGQFFHLQEDAVLLAWLAQSFCLFFIALSYEAGKKFLTERPISLGGFAGAFLFFLQAVFILFNKYYGVNVAGDARVAAEGVPAIKHFFTVLRPDILFFLIAIHLGSQRWFYANSFIYFISMMMRGWMGGIFLLMLLWVCRVGKIQVFGYRGLLFGFFCIALILISPFLLEAKLAVRSGHDVFESFASVVSSGFFGRLMGTVLYLSNRFEHISAVALLIENSGHFYQSYIEGGFSTYWLDGFPQLALLKIAGKDFYGLHHYMVEYFFNVEPHAWATHPGAAGWIFVLQERVVFFVAYFVVFVVLSFLTVAQYAGGRLYMLVTCFSLVYFFHGWFWSYINFLFYLGVFVFLLRLNNLSVFQKRNVAVI